MALTNAQKQARYRARRDSWPKTDAQMRRLLCVAYWLGRQEEKEDRESGLSWEQIEARILDAYIRAEEDFFGSEPAATIEDIRRAFTD